MWQKSGSTQTRIPRQEGGYPWPTGVLPPAAVSDLRRSGTATPALLAALQHGPAPRRPQGTYLAGAPAMVYPLPGAPSAVPLNGAQTGAGARDRARARRITHV